MEFLWYKNINLGLKSAFLIDKTENAGPDLVEQIFRPLLDLNFKMLMIPTCIFFKKKERWFTQRCIVCQILD